MAQSVDTLGKAGRHNMVVRAECGCGNIRHFRASDLAMHFGAGRDPRDLKFSCNRCRPNISVTLLELDRDRMPAISVWRPHRKGRDQPTVWMPERLR